MRRRRSALQLTPLFMQLTPLFLQPTPSHPVVAQLSWYPAFAGRYTSAWGKEYGPCKTHEMAKGKEAERTYYDVAMWQTCRPGAMRAHDAALGRGGSGHEATPPFVMRALYGPKVRLVSTGSYMPLPAVTWADFWYVTCRYMGRYM